MRTRRWRRVLVPLSGITLLLAVGARPVSALGVLTISGVVDTAEGTPISGASVTDGNQGVSTDSQGQYSFQETSFSSYTVTASYPGMQDADAQVALSATSPAATQNYRLLWLSASSVGEKYISTATAPASLTYTLMTYTPNPGSPGQPGASCGNVTDSLTGASSSMSFAGTRGGESVWSWSETLAQNTAQGDYTLKGVVDDCVSGVELDTGATASYVVDNTPPTIVELLPLDGGNTAFTSQPLMAIATDSLSGVNPSSYTLTLDNVTTGATNSYSGSAVTVRNGVAQTAPLTLVTGDIYRVSVSVADNAGNPATFNQSTGFEVNSETPSPSTTASIPSTPCTLSGGSGLSTTQTATCTNVPMNLVATSTQLSGAMTTPASGYVDETVSLSSAQVSTSVNGQVVNLPAYPTSAPTVTEPMLFKLSGPVTNATAVAVPTASDNLGTVTIQIPTTWKSASISMSSASSSASVPTCPDPVTATPAFSCEPDPLQFGYAIILNKTTVSNVSSEANADATQFNLTIIGADQSRTAFQAFIPPTEMPALASDHNVVLAAPEIPGPIVTNSPVLGPLPSTSNPCWERNKETTYTYWYVNSDGVFIDWGTSDFGGYTWCDESLYVIEAGSLVTNPGGEKYSGNNDSWTNTNAYQDYWTQGSASCLDDCYGHWTVTYGYQFDFYATDPTGPAEVLDYWENTSNWSYSGYDGPPVVSCQIDAADPLDVFCAVSWTWSEYP